MRLALGDVFTAAIGLWRAERPLLAPLAGLFYLLPALALLLLLPQPEAAGGDSQAASEALIAYALDNASAILAANLVQLFGAGAILSLFLARPRPSVADALRNAPRMLPWLAVAMILVWAMVFVGGFLILPGLYLIGRCFLVSSVLIGEAGAGPVQAITRSFALTRGRGWALFAMAAMIFLPGQLIVTIAGSFDRAVIDAGMGSPVTAIVFNLVAALGASAAAVFTLLVKVVVYRALVPSKGI